MNRINIALIGAGDRGLNCYASYIKRNPWKARLVAVAEIDDAKRNLCSEMYDIPDNLRFKDMYELLDHPKLADAVLICTSDKLHYKPAILAMRQGYHILLEKPMATTPKECIQLEKAAKEYDKTLILCYVLRYTEFFTTIHKIIKNGDIGEINSIVHMENIPLIDQVHSFTRGIFRNTDIAAPIILSHCCHDLDLISWYADSKCKKVASFGGLTHFCGKSAPEGAPERCLDRCPYADTCPYYAPNYYLTDNIGWPTSTICTDMSIEARLKAIKEGPYGRCVYHCDNNVSDNQTVIMEFENGVTASFSLQPFASANGRTLKITGSKGELQADMEINEIEVTDLRLKQKKTYRLQTSIYKYGGGDNGIMEYFVERVRAGCAGGRTSMQSSLESHIIAFAAEEARIRGITVDIDKYVSEHAL